LNLKNIVNIAKKAGGQNHGFKFLQVPVIISSKLDKRNDARSICLEKSTKWFFA
jgi:hypothetical protein